MGESYKGLTIRIGGDTTGLQKALHDVNSAASATQAQLRRVSKGLKADPRSAALANMQLEKTADLSQDAAERLARLRRAEAQLRGTGVAKVAGATRNAALAAQRANDAYNDVDAELERVNRSFRDMAQASGYQTVVRDNAALARELHEVGIVSDEAYAKYRRLADAHGALQSNLSDAKAVEAYKDLGVEVAASKAEVERLKGAMVEARRASDAGIPKGMREACEAVARTERAARSLEDEMRHVSEGLSMDPGNADLMVRKARLLSDQIEAAKEHASSLRAAMGTLGVGKVTESTASLAAEVERCEGRWADAKVRVDRAREAVADLRAEQQKLYLKGDLGERYRKLASQAEKAEAKVASLAREEREASRALDLASARREMRDLSVQAEKAEAKVRGLKGELAHLGKAGFGNLRSFAGAMSATATAGLAAVGYKAVDSAERIDGAYRDMKKTVSGSEEQFESIRAAALDFASTHPVSADTILEIEALGGQLGIEVEQLQDFAHVVSNLDIATNMDADDIATAMGQLRNVMHWGEGDFERFGDALVRLGNNMPAQEDAIVNITKRIGAAGTMYGFTTPQVLAWATAIAATGQNCEAAGTAVSNTMSMMEQAVASGGESLEAWASVAQMSSDEFAEAWNTDPSGAFQRFIQGLADIEANGGSAEVALANLGINGARQKQALKGLTQTIGVLNDALVMSDDAWNGYSDQFGEAGDAEREAAAKAEGFSGAIQVLRNCVDELAMSLGEAALPFIRAFTDLVRTATDTFQSWPPQVRSAAVAIAGLIAAAGPAAMLVSGLSQVKDAAVGIVGPLKGAHAATKALGTVSGLAKAGLVGLALAGVGLLAKKAYEAWKRSDTLRRATEGLADACDKSRMRARENADEVERLGSKARTSSEEVDALVDKQAQLADTIASRSDSVADSAAMIDHYADEVERLNGCEATAENLAKLKTAVGLLNEACGTSYTVEEEGGAYYVMADGAKVANDAIERLIETKKLEARNEAVAANYKDAYAQMLEDKRAYEQAVADLDEAVRVRDEARASLEGHSALDITLNGELRDAQRACNEASIEIERLQGDVQRLGGCYDATVKSTEYWGEALELSTWAMRDSAAPYAQMLLDNEALATCLQRSSQGVYPFIEALENSGLAVEAFSGLTREQVATLAENFDGSLDSIVQSLLTFAESMDDDQKNAMLAYIQSMAEAAPQAQGVASDAAAYTEEGLSQAVGPAGEVGGEVEESYDGAIEDGYGDSADAGEGLGEASVDGMRSGSDGAYGVGADYASGYASGVMSGVDAAYSAGYAVGSASVRGARDAGQVNSPSRVMRGIGSYFSQGFALGIGDGAADVEREARRMASLASRHAARAASVSGDHASYRAALPGGRAQSLSKADLYDAMSAAVKSAGEPVFELNVDGRRLTGAIAGHMESALGAMSVRSYR